MILEKKILAIMEKGPASQFTSYLIKTGLKNSRIRKVLIKAIEKAIYQMSLKESNRPQKVKEDRFYMGRALLASIENALSSGSMSKESMEKLKQIVLSKILVEGIHTREEFKEIHGFRPPLFITISPTNVCNLKCTGCYAGEVYAKTALDYEIFDKIISDMKREFSAHFFVISGGEPFMYKSHGKTLLDILAKHQDCYFMAYTNATLINKEKTKELAKLGNFSPAISVEGFEKETDERRGKGTWKKIMGAMDNLKESGVMFGISVTPCAHNADLLLSDEFIDFFFQEKKAFYGWYFQYMCIGRKPSLDLMVTPEQRVKMYKKIWKRVRERKTFIADFWNSGTASDGCMAAARGGGYFYIMWDGTITPCVFIPFVDKEYGNIYEVYKKGKTLTDVIKSPFFSGIRKWQSSYWMDQPKEKCGNLLAPCIIRDNAEVFYDIVKEAGAQPVDEGARTYLSFVEQGQMLEYNRKYRELTEPIWEKEYLKKKRGGV
ncbi:MAG: radical SAM protein [bacterium (Candidatus Ratteibacteria) CG_4_9_14_3_um_filter_41_21]|uniref:Radical SAM protein n=2 Tax=Candidatus Ratteibacteria TaxID=2979319 RepID=A0A2M7E8Y8_9BACT|nr:radical SAM protein [Candidatus Parcubacteria bacterium]PIV64216.1 MAG: radical SAM protein [bacterium (Candidatus Ratteibacteria) CG01_land_8_20_14_3_00_40_19]PJA61928.1 MAG: radical SAM protein [bacterium (Candidatus Ratteibacteria) CG_4_9_14_3_um_filter_41_21]